MLPPTIFSVSVGITVATFVSIRFTELPLLVYIFFPFTAFTIIFVTFGMCYDAVLIVRTSADITGTLLSPNVKYVRQMLRGGAPTS